MNIMFLTNMKKKKTHPSLVERERERWLRVTDGEKAHTASSIETSCKKEP